jgi:hypothetical protein
MSEEHVNAVKQKREEVVERRESDAKPLRELQAREKNASLPEFSEKDSTRLDALTTELHEATKLRNQLGHKLGMEGRTPEISAKAKPYEHDIAVLKKRIEDNKASGRGVKTLEVKLKRLESSLSKMVEKDLATNKAATKAELDAVSKNHEKLLAEYKDLTSRKFEHGEADLRASGNKSTAAPDRRPLSAEERTRMKGLEEKVAQYDEILEQFDHYRANNEESFGHHETLEDAGGFFSAQKPITDINYDSDGKISFSEGGDVSKRTFLDSNEFKALTVGERQTRMLDFSRSVSKDVLLKSVKNKEFMKCLRMAGMNLKSLWDSTYLRRADKAFAPGHSVVSYDLVRAKNTVQAVAHELGMHAAQKVEFLNFADLTPADRQSLAKLGGLDNGMAFTRDNGSVVLIADRHTDVGDVLKSFLHESSHSSEGFFFGSEQKASVFFRDVANVFRKEVNAYLDANGLAKDARNIEVAAREVFADKCSDIVPSEGGIGFKHKAVGSFFERAKGMLTASLRAVGRSMGMDLSFTKTEIENMAFRFIESSSSLRGKGFLQNVQDKLSLATDKAGIVKRAMDGFKATDETDFYGHAGRSRSIVANLIDKHINPGVESAARFFAASGMSDKDFSEFVSAFGGLKGDRRAILDDMKLRYGKDSVQLAENAYSSILKANKEIVEYGIKRGHYTKAQGDAILSGNKLFAKAGDNIVSETFSNLVNTVQKIERNSSLQYLYRFSRLNPHNGTFKILSSDPTRAESGRVLEVRVNGEIQHLEVRDALTYRALKNINDVDMTYFTKTLHQLNKLSIKANLALNPAYWTKNLGRDVMFASFNMMSKDKIGTMTGGEMTKGMLKDLPSAIKGLYDSHFRGGSSEWGDMVKLLNDGGVNMGLPQIGNVEAISKSFKSMVEMQQGSLKGKAIAFNDKYAGRWISGMANITENAVRISVLRQCKKAGLSDQQALNFAKEVSINFDRHGEMTNTLSALYLFSNAKIQGARQFARIIKENPRNFSFLALGLANLGFATAFMGRLIAGDDYDKVPDHVRSDNILMMLPGMGSGHLKMSLPNELMPLYNAGQAAADMLHGIPATRAIRPVVANTFSALNPIGGFGMGVDSPKNMMQGAGQAATPSFFRPVYEAIIGRNWHGNPIPEGDGASYVATSIAGGVGKFISDGYKTFSGKGDVNSLPIVNVFAGKAPTWRRDYPSRGDYDEAAAPFKAIAEDIESNPQGREETLKGLSSNDKELLTMTIRAERILKTIGGRRKKAEALGHNVDVYTKQMEEVRKNYLRNFKNKAR